MSRGHERAVEPFSDIHAENGKVIATLLHDPTVEGLDMALYLDGSGSMKLEYERSLKTRTLREWWNNEPAEQLPNRVETQARWMLEYLATKDRNGQLRVAYWACGGQGMNVEVIGELAGSEAKSYGFPGPRQP